MAAPKPPGATFIGPAQGDLDHDLYRKTAQILACGIGLFGKDAYADASTHTGNWWILHAVSDTVVAGIAYATGYAQTGSASLVGQTIKAGDRIYGRIISFSASSGAYELYRAPQ